MEAIHTKGNVQVQKIKIGDVHYEFEMATGCFIKSEVLTLPTKNSDGNWIWKSKNLLTGDVIDYLVNPSFSRELAVNLFDYKAFEDGTQV